MSFRILSPVLRSNRVFLEKCTIIFSRNPRRTFKSNTEPVPEQKNDEPIKFSTSKAATWKAKYSSSGEDYEKTPRAQGLIVVSSMAIFMVYFCIFREENDLDDMLRQAEKKVPLLVQESQLRVDIEEAKKARRDTSSLEKKLELILKMKKELDAQR